MRIAEYVKDCIDFANDTKDWGSFDVYKYYTTVGNGWEESSDNAIGGIDVAWAFKMSPQAIEKAAAQYFADSIAEMLEQAIEENWDREQLKGICDLIW